MFLHYFLKTLSFHCFHFERITMVELNLDGADGADISIWVKIIIFLALLAMFGFGIELYRRLPFIAFYLYSLLLFTLPATIYSHGADTVIMIIKCLFVSLPFFVTSLWRISSITEDLFNDHFVSFPLNYFVYRKLKGKFSEDIMEWICGSLFFANIIWSVVIDFSVGSYYNASCGLILAFTVPLPSTIGWSAPGYTVDGEERKVDLLVPDLHWFWIMLYTSFDMLSTWMHTLNIYVSILHLIPCYLYCAIMSQRWDLYLMIRTLNLYAVIQVVSPWNWISEVLGEPVIIENEMIPIIWGACHLGLAVIYLVYYVVFVWKTRVYSTAAKEETQLDEVVSVAGHADDQAHHPGADQKSLSYGEDSEYIVYK